MNNSKLFENSYAEITLPLSEKAIRILRRIKSLDSIMDEYNNLLESPIPTAVFMEMTICFNFDSMETLLTLLFFILPTTIWDQQKNAMFISTVKRQTTFRMKH